MLTGSQIAELVDALAGAFDLQELDLLLRAELDKRLEYLVAPGPPPRDVVFQLVNAAERAGWVYNLIDAAYLYRPNKPALAEIYRETAEEAFTSAVRRDLPFLDLAPWLERADRVRDAVCLLECRGQPLGTGFLVGPDIVLTCFSVIDSNLYRRSEIVHSGEIDARFDYKRLPDGSLTHGLAVRLEADDWLIDESPYAPAETGTATDTPLPTSDELDYALLRLSRPIGAEPLPDPRQGRERRGWLRVPIDPPDLTPGASILLAHCPDGGPVQFAFEGRGIIRVNANGTRVRYRISTRSGSAGAPCFGQAWDLIALHHLREPTPYGRPPRYKQGIPIAAIRERLQRIGKADVLGDEPS